MRFPVVTRRLRAIIWTLALPIPAICISWLLLSFVLPFSAKHKMNRRMQINAPYLNIQLDADAMEWPPQPGFLPPFAFRPDKFTITDLNFTGLLQADLVTGAYRHWWRKFPLTRQNTGFNGSVIANWLSPTGANPTDPRVQYACNQIYKAISEMHQGTAANTTPFLDQSGNPIGSARPDLPPPQPCLVCVNPAGSAINRFTGLQRTAGPDVSKNLASPKPPDEHERSTNRLFFPSQMVSTWTRHE
jgi:hypothetical protein